MNISVEELWSQVFGPLDPDTVLNQIDQQVEEEEYCDREEGFLDKVEEALSGKLKAEELTAMAQKLQSWAAEQE